MNTTKSICPLCQENVMGHYESRYDRQRDLHQNSCKRCGEYLIPWDAAIDLKDNNVQMHLISGFVREANLRGGKLPLVNSANIKVIISNAPADPIEKADRFILNLALMMKDEFTIASIESVIDFPLAYCRNAIQLETLITLLIEAGILKTGHLGLQYILTALGWERIREIRKTTLVDSKQAFVAMNFNPELNSLFDVGIEPAINNAGFKPYRIDREEHNDKIDDLIIAEIRRSRFMVADFTGHRQGVYFEAGFALGLGIPVIWCCNKADLNDTHFDTRQYNHIDWDSEKELQARLYERIRATIL